MKIIRCEHGSDAWHAARLGIPTASQFHRLITPGGKPSAQADGYLYELVAGRLLGHPVSTEAVGWMERGVITEAEAVAYYEMQAGRDTERVGFVATDDGRTGCSPDRLVGPDGLLELKCPSAAVHVGYLLEADAPKYRAQIQGQLWITGRQWVDFLSYCPELPPALVRYERDEKYIEALAEAVADFSLRLDEAHAKLLALVQRVA